MTWVDWCGVALAVVLLIVLPILEILYRRERARDWARWEEQKRHIAKVYGAEILRASLPLKAQDGRDE